MNITLSKRLTACLQAVKPYLVIADIGTDHGYLPCAGILNQQLTHAIAADVASGPLQAAQSQVDRYALQETIETRLGSGLSVLQPGEVEAVVIAGMGGKLIVSLLQANMMLTRSFKRLVLQPNIDAALIRECLLQNQFELVSEMMVLEDEKFYEVIVAEPRGKKCELDELDVAFGPFLRREKSEVFVARWEKELHKNALILTQLEVNHPRALEIKKRQARLKEALGYEN